MTDDELWEKFRNTPIKFWCCPMPMHRFVTWNGDVATCDECGRTNVPAPVREPHVLERVVNTALPAMILAPALLIMTASEIAESLPSPRVALFVLRCRLRAWVTS